MPNADVHETLKDFLDDEDDYAAQGDPNADGDETDEEEDDEDEGDEDEPSDLPAKKNPHDATWAARNPDKDALPARKSKKLDKQTEKTCRAANAMKKAEMLAEMTKATEEIQATLANLSEKIHKPMLWCHRMMMKVFGAKHRRRSQIHNACSHFASEKT